ncbi:DsbA family protein [Brevundimonas nasdae]|jgi:protein-disulfide isomerase|uniref:DsbA family protein n=1 Tax=Brevundimonas nasdae TaxID=172043 RepID=A0ABX8THZ7_9CAUL|nr:DsbA family protein [Brevundimonas nasdae]QYC10624.1 DsbA family protein [Brevundimonas nasdae]QYC13411.1 DsbA family protein [Brevundimonas nasdae]
MAQTESRLARMSRRAAITGAAMATMALAACGGGAKGAAEGDMAQGAAEGAKVTVVEYASVTCPHCAIWQENTYPAFKAKYVDTGKVRYIFRELPTPPVDAATAGFLVARCAGPDKYFDVVHQLMKTQQEMITTSPREWLLRTAQAAGLSEEQFNQCVTDKNAVAAMEKRVQAARAQGVTGTPAFYVNDTQVISPGGEGASLADLSAAIDAALAK